MEIVYLLPSGQYCVTNGLHDGQVAVNFVRQVGQEWRLSGGWGHVAVADLKPTAFRFRMP